jgi:hypothetical protein
MVGAYDGKLIPLETSLAPSIFGCSQGNKLIEKIILNIGDQTMVPQSIPEIMRITGPEMFSRMVVNELGNCPMSVVFPPTYFYPFPMQQRELIRGLNFDDTQTYIKPYIYPETYATHLWYCSWQKANLL